MTTKTSNPAVSRGLVRARTGTGSRMAAAAGRFAVVAALVAAATGCIPIGIRGSTQFAQRAPEVGSAAAVEPLAVAAR